MTVLQSTLILNKLKLVKPQDVITLSLYLAYIGSPGSIKHSALILLIPYPRLLRNATFSWIVCWIVCGKVCWFSVLPPILIVSSKLSTNFSTKEKLTKWIRSSDLTNSNTQQLEVNYCLRCFNVWRVCCTIRQIVTSTVFNWLRHKYSPLSLAKINLVTLDWHLHYNYYLANQNLIG